MEKEKKIIEILKALSEENRLKLFLFLSIKPLCVCELEQLFHISLPTISLHLKVLKHANLIESKKQSRWIQYSIVPSKLNIKLLQFLKKELHFETKFQKEIQIINQIHPKHAKNKKKRFLELTPKFNRF